MVGAIIFQPINRVLPLRCLEEKYGLSNNQRERLMAQERRSQKCLSLNISNGHAQDGGHAPRNGAQGCDSGHAGQLRWVGDGRRRRAANIDPGKNRRFCPVWVEILNFSPPE